MYSNLFIFRLPICRLFLRAFSSQHYPSQHICRRLFCVFSTKTGQMHNPLDMATYRVETEIYRRNCPLETASTAAPAALRVTVEETGTFGCGADEDQQSRSPSSSGRSSSSEVRPATDLADSGSESPGKSYTFVEVRVSTDDRPSSSITAEIAQEIGEVSGGRENVSTIFVERKTVESEFPVVSADDGYVYTEKIQDKTLIGTVQYDDTEGHFFDRLRVPTSLVGILRGKECNKQKKIEALNRCTINFPAKHKAGDETEIEICSTESALHVQRCREALEKAVADARRTAAPTHFLSMPIFDTNFRKQYSEFVARICNDETLPSELRNQKMFMKQAKLHLTLNVLRLFTEDEIQRVRHFLNELFQSDQIRKILLGTDGRFRTEFKTLHSLDPSPKSCKVLYAQPESERLQQLATAIDDALTKAGMVQQRRNDDLLLHMTVLNTKYLWQGRIVIDATPILERFGQLDFDAIDVDQLHLCEMRGNLNPTDPNGYISVHSIKFATAAD